MDFSEAVKEFSEPLGASESGRGEAIHFCNAYSVALAEQDRDFRELIEKADVVCCDGVPITWAGKIFYGDENLVWDRVYGPDVMAAVMALGQAAGAKHYLLGGTVSTLDTMIRVIGERWPGAVVVGAESPPFRDLTATELAQQVERICESGATHVWVGLGQPKQDFAVAYLASQVAAKFFSVGAAFDFLAGTKSQAPSFIQKSGTEWLYRFATEPRRLGRRYLWGNPMFVYSCFKHGRKSLVNK